LKTGSWAIFGKKCAADVEGWGEGFRSELICNGTHAAPLVCHESAGKWYGSSVYSGVVGA
jgi:hypothetical protein